MVALKYVKHTTYLYYLTLFDCTLIMYIRCVFFVMSLSEMHQDALASQTTGKWLELMCLECIVQHCLPNNCTLVYAYLLWKLELSQMYKLLILPPWHCLVNSCNVNVYFYRLHRFTVTLDYFYFVKNNKKGKKRNKRHVQTLNPPSTYIPAHRTCGKHLVNNVASIRAYIPINDGYTYKSQ